VRHLNLYEEHQQTSLKDFTKNGLVKKWVFVGDTSSKFDAGSQTKVTIETNTISIFVKEN
jgi:hypothetical protein